MPLQGLGRRRFKLDASCVLYLPLYELDGAKIRSKDAYGHLATVTGALWTPQGRTFVAAGGDRIVVPDAASIDFTNALTLIAWVKLSAIDAWNGVIGKATTIWSQTSYTLRVLLDNTFSADLSADGVTPVALTVAGALSKDVWYHLATTFNRPDRVLYKNGVSVATSSWDNDVFVGTSDIYLGKYAGDSATVSGTIGEVFLYNRALTALEIQHIYLATKWRYV